MTLRSIPALLAIGCALLLATGVAHAKPMAPCVGACLDEPEPTLPAPALVQPALLSGPNFRVIPEVQVRGYMAHFLIDTTFGPISADSVEMLGVRVGEMPAIEALDRASRSEAFGQAIAERGKKTGNAIVNVVSHPVDAITGLPVGVVRYLRAQLDTWTSRAQAVADRSSRQFENRGDPFRAPPGPMTAGRLGDDGDAGNAQKKSRSWYARLGSEAGREAKRYLKYSQQRRAMAKLLGVDPNSTNPILNDKLDTLAWAAVGGNFSAAQALGQVAGTAADVISYSGKVNQYVLEKEPEPLREDVRKRLAKFCSDDDSVRSFLHRGGFTDTQRVALVEALEKLRPESGCNELVELATTTRGEVEARYLTNSLKLIETRAARGVGTLIVAGSGLAWRGADGRLLLPLPVDYLTWNHDLGAFFDQRELAGRDRTVLIGGDASMAAQREMTARGWSLALRAPYAGAPLYAGADVSRGRPQ